MTARPYNKLRDIRIGLDIFARHGAKNCAAEHDVFYAGETLDVTDEEHKALNKAGWFWDEEMDSWKIFT